MKVHTNRPLYHKEGSVEVTPASGPGEGPIRRFAIHKDNLVTQPFEGIETVYDVLAYAARTHGTRNAVGWRDIVDIHEEEKEVKKVVGGKEVTEKKKWKYFELSDCKYMNYIEFKDAVCSLARAFVDIGITTEEVFNVYAQTSHNWQLIAHACGAISTTIATAYDTLGEDGLAHSLNEPDCAAIFTNAELLPTLVKVLPKTPTVRFVIYDGKPSASILSSVKSVRDSIQVFSIEELRERGKPLSDDLFASRLPKPDKLACIMYTSGSTGAPKGVTITHSNLIASVGAIRELLGHHLTVDDTFLAFLPLAHVLEYIVEVILLFVGVTTCYGRVKTLTDASVRNCKGDIAAFRPSIMVGVPAVWETIRKGILAKVNSSGSLKKNLFHGAFAVKKAGIPILSYLADSIVFSGIRAATGGRLRLALSGGAALSKETQEFFCTTIVTLVQGYGMTESCGMCAVLPPELLQYGAVGLPVASIEVKLLDVAEAGYLSTNNPQQGEVCIRGPSVTKGYYKRPDLNDDETIFTKDGWLRTGDVGQWNSDGTMTLIDRIKNLVKLQHGEYIALEQLEAIYKACNLVSNICVHATAEATRPMAIIVPHEPHLRHALQQSSSDPQAYQNKSLTELCHDPTVKDLVLKDCNAVGKKSGFKPVELLQAVILTPEEWTPENGLVTAAQKIQRLKIAKTFEADIKEVYKRQGD
ncbi:long-chain-fatty-acid-CoA-ligase [Amanita muscaria]